MVKLQILVTLCLSFLASAATAATLGNYSGSFDISFTTSPAEELLYSSSNVANGPFQSTFGDSQLNFQGSGFAVTPMQLVTPVGNPNPIFVTSGFVGAEIEAPGNAFGIASATNVLVNTMMFKNVGASPETIDLTLDYALSATALSQMLPGDQALVSSKFLFSDVTAGMTLLFEDEASAFANVADAGGTASEFGAPVISFVLLPGEMRLFNAELSARAGAEATNNLPPVPLPAGLLLLLSGLGALAVTRKRA